MNALTQERLKEILEYDQNTGIFLWKEKISKKVIVGEIAGYLESRGYWEICIFGRKYKAHRIAWLYVYGNFPTNQIDHINRVRTDNSIFNLREATNLENSLNHDANKNNKSGFRGVHWNSNTQKWRAQARLNGKRIELGLHKTAELAAEAYRNFIKQNHGVFANI